MPPAKKVQLALNVAFTAIGIVVIASGWRAVPRCGWAQAVPLLIFTPLVAMLTATAAWNLIGLASGRYQPLPIAVDEGGRPLPVGLGSVATAVIGLTILASLAGPECLANGLF